MEKPKLEKMQFDFSQDGNCNAGSDFTEFLTIECESSLGIDNDKDCFFILKTEKWSIDKVEELEELFNRIRRVINK